MNEPAVSVKNLTKSFSGRTVVDNLSFDVRRGEVFALLGHNGAGKSTTIDLILGLKKPDSGTAVILGMDAAGHRKQVFDRVGVQLQNTRYQQPITVEEACIEYASLYAAPADYPMLLLSGASIPVEVFPKGFQTVAKLMPLGIGIDLLKSVSVGCYDRIAIPMMTLIAITVLCGTIAVQTFRWE